MLSIYFTYLANIFSVEIKTIQNSLLQIARAACCCHKSISRIFSFCKCTKEKSNPALTYSYKISKYFLSSKYVSVSILIAFFYQRNKFLIQRFNVKFFNNIQFQILFKKKYWYVMCIHIHIRLHSWSSSVLMITTQIFENSEEGRRFVWRQITSLF